MSTNFKYEPNDPPLPREEKKRLFLYHYEKCLSVIDSSTLAEVKSTDTIYNWLKQDRDFFNAFNDIKHKNKKRRLSLAHLLDSLDLNPTPQLLIRLLNSSLFENSEYRAIKMAKKSTDNDTDIDNEEITLEL